MLVIRQILLFIVYMFSFGFKFEFNFKAFYINNISQLKKHATEFFFTVALLVKI